MIRLWETIASLLEEVRIAREQSIKNPLGREAEEPWEMEISLPLSCKLRTSIPDADATWHPEVERVIEASLEVLNIERAQMNEPLLFERLQQEVEHFYHQWVKASSHQDRNLSDFCQRVLVIFGDPLLFPKQWNSQPEQGAEEASIRFEKLTQALSERLHDLFDRVSPQKYEVWIAEDATRPGAADGVYSPQMKLKVMV